MSKLTVKNAAGENQEVDLQVDVYRKAVDAGQTVPQYLNTTYPTNAAKDGTAFEQLMEQTGLFVHADATYGLRPPTMAECINGTANMNAGVITRDAQPASRILFPAVFLEAMEDKLKTDTKGYVAQFESMIAVNDTINGARFEQPILNYSRPEAARHQGIAQLALPNSMLSITTSDVARKIPTFSLGMEISQEAMKASTLDLVSLALVRQADIERAANVDRQIGELILGDLDLGTAAVASVTSDSLDNTGTVAGGLTHKAWIKWLRTNWRKRQIDWVWCDLATAMKIEAREGKPMVVTDNPTSPRIDALSSVTNPSWQPVKIFLVEDGVIAADTLVGIDSRYAIRKVRNSQAEYSAVEQFVLRKSEAMRFDFGEIAYRLFEDAWSVMTISA